MSNITVPLAVLQEVIDAMDDMATDSRLLDMKQSMVHQFDAARDALRAALEQPDTGNPATAPEGRKLAPVEPTPEMAIVGRNAHHEAEKKTYEPCAWGANGFANRAVRAAYVYRAMLDAAPQPPALGRPQSNPTPYLYYDPENGDTWTQEAIDEGFSPTDNLIALYTK